MRVKLCISSNCSDISKIQSVQNTTHTCTHKKKRRKKYPLKQNYAKAKKIQTIPHVFAHHRPFTLLNGSLFLCNAVWLGLVRPHTTRVIYVITIDFERWSLCLPLFASLPLLMLLRTKWKLCRKKNETFLIFRFFFLLFFVHFLNFCSFMANGSISFRARLFSLYVAMLTSFIF